MMLLIDTRHIWRYGCQQLLCGLFLLIAVASLPSCCSESIGGVIEVKITGLPTEARELRITADVDGERHSGLKATDNLQDFGIPVPDGLYGATLNVEIAAFDRTCSIAVGRQTAAWRAGEQRVVTVDLKACSGCWCPEVPPQPAKFTGVFAAAEDAVWLLGQDTPIYRYDGLSWSADTQESQHLIALWGTDPNNIFAGGGCGFPSDIKLCPYRKTPANVIMQRGVSEWLNSASAPGLGQYEYIWGSSASDVWTGGYIGQYDSLSKVGVIAHGIGEQPGHMTWTSYKLEESSSIQGIWGDRYSSIWAGGQDKQGNYGLWKLPASQAKWIPIKTSDAFGGAGSLSWFWGGQEYIWMVGEFGVIAKIDVATGSILPDLKASGINQNLNSVWGQNDHAAVVVGDDGTVLEWSTSGWQRISVSVHQCSDADPACKSCPDNNHAAGLFSVSGHGGDKWAVGDCGTILHYRSY